MNGAAGEGWLYRAEAFALSVSMRRPFAGSVSIGAALPSIGGRVEEVRGGFTFGNDVVSFGAATLVVEGVERGDRFHETVARAVVSDLSIMDTLRVRQLVMTAIGSYDARWTSERKYPNILTGPCEIDGLEINRHPFQTDFESWTRGRWRPPSREGADALRLLAATNDKRRFDVPDFGRIYYQQVRSNGHETELTALRVELGSPVGGTIVAGSVRVDGNWYP